jgi:threonine dehydratase
MQPIIPTARDVAEAAIALGGWLRETPLLESIELDERVGARVLLKPECLQHGGSFKIRGAMNRLLGLSDTERRAGVVAFSSGNHGLAVALAAHWLRIPATIVMPKDAPEIKRRSVLALGAELVPYDRYEEDREEIATRLTAARGAALVPPFEHPDVIAGQGTVGREIAAGAQARKLELDCVYVPCSGGGLVAGCALALKSVYPACKIFAVEPEGYDDTARSLAAGTRLPVASGGKTICDALMAATPGAISFAINKRLLAGAVAVGDAEVLDAMKFAAEHLKLVVEPSGAAALAAVLGRSRSGECAAVVLSGGNVDSNVLIDALSRADLGRST